MITPNELKELLQKGSNPPQVLLDGDQYEKKRLTFNRRFQKRPAAIVLCTSTKQVAHVVKIAKEHPDYPLRIKSGGHDHEAECSATGGIVIDFTNWKSFKVNLAKKTVKIHPGVRFQDIIPQLDEAGISIPHGTCESVGVFGFTFGGGWGPWTRLHGMCCEHLIGATIVLGDGRIRKLHIDREEDKELLWALRGGGGFSYGVVTRITLRTFEQPPKTLRFTLTWTKSAEESIPPAIDILKRWETLIASNQNEQLIGTNLQIMAIPKDEKSLEESIHDCTFYGYYAGTEKEVIKDLKNWFSDLPWTGLEVITTDEIRDEGKMKNPNLLKVRGNFSNWGRISKVNIERAAQIKNDKSDKEENRYTHFPSDVDHPAPHKITNRLVQEGGLGEEGRKNLIKSLRSKLIFHEGIQAHLHTYVTLGAISGSYYGEKYDFPDFPSGSSFPYKKRPYIIQYQAWWDTDLGDIKAGKEFHIHDYANRAMDWIAECRCNHFPQTNGAFISFKDRGIPTSTYFAQNYQRLIEIKEKYSADSENIFRSRKTIY